MHELSQPVGELVEYCVFQEEQEDSVSGPCDLCACCKL